MSSSIWNKIFSSSSVAAFTAGTNSIPKTYRYSQFSNLPRLCFHTKIHASRLETEGIAEIQNSKTQKDSINQTESLYRSEGIFAVYKPLEWTSQDVVAYIRGILQRDARDRGLKVERVRKRGGNKKRMLKVGHGGTLDPLATGVLVIGVGKGTKELQSYLNGAKSYRASAKLGFETTTLDLEGDIIKEVPFDDITVDTLQNTLPSFTGSIMQVPPIYSAIRKDGKKLYEQAREGKTEEDVQIDAREVEVYSIDLLTKDHNDNSLPHFGLDISCGKGTFIRSLVRDIGRSLDTAATMTYLERTQQGPFGLEHALHRDDWSPDNIYNAIDHANQLLSSEQS